MHRQPTSNILATLLVLGLPLACSSQEAAPSPYGGTTAGANTGSTTAGNASTTGTSGVGGSSSGTTTAGTPTTTTTAATSIATTAAPTTTTAAATTAAATTTAGVDGGSVPLPATCSAAAAPYSVSRTALDSSLVPTSSGGGFNSESRTMFPVSAAAGGQVYVGLNSASGAVVAGASGGALATTPDATLGGLTATSDGFAALYFGEMWASVKRFDASGQELFSTDLFRSPNLDDVGTKGEASTGRLGYLSETDELVAYFAHTQRYDDGVRHQGGYLATLSPSGEQELLSGWFGSHNLDQRLLTSGGFGAVLGLGDAYPIGIFYSSLGSSDPRPQVVYRLAAAGNGTANGQLGGIVELSQDLIVPFITNLSVSPDIDAGEWPNIDDAVATQIREAAANGTDMGILRVPKSGPSGDGDAPTVWLAPELSAGARLVHLKATRYGDGDMVLLIWAEASGDDRDASLSYFTMVIDGMGAVCQPKTPLDAAYAVTSGDDIVRGPGGQIYWANNEGGLGLVTLVPQ